MSLLGIVERPGVSWGVLGCPGVIRPTRAKGDKRFFHPLHNKGKNICRT